MSPAESLPTRIIDAEYALCYKRKHFLWWDGEDIEMKLSVTVFGFVVSFVGVALFVVGCGYDQNEKLRIPTKQEQGPTPMPTPPTGPVPTWDDVNKTIFTPKCGSCHNEYTVLSNVKADIQNILVKADGGMGNLTTAEKAKLHAWVDGGMPSAAQPTPTPVPVILSSITNPKWNDIKTYFVPKCLPCHGAGGNLMDLTDKATFKDADLRPMILDSIKTGAADPMPPKTVSASKQLTDDERNLLLRWVANNLPD